MYVPLCNVYPSMTGVIAVLLAPISITNAVGRPTENEDNVPVEHINIAGISIDSNNISLNYMYINRKEEESSWL